MMHDVHCGVKHWLSDLCSVVLIIKTRVYFCVDLFLLLETGGTGAEGKDER